MAGPHRAQGWAGEIRVVADDEPPAEERSQFNTAQDLSVDSRRIRAELGYQEITDPAEALRLSIVWERLQLDRERDPADAGALD